MNGARLPEVERLGGGQILLRGAALRDAASLARSGAEQVSRRNGDGIPLRAEVVDLLAALEQEAQSARASVNPLSEFRGSVSEATCRPDDQIGSQEAARMLGCGDRWARYRADELGGWKVGRCWVFSRAEVAAYAADRREMSA